MKTTITREEREELVEVFGSKSKVRAFIRIFEIKVVKNQEDKNDKRKTKR